MTELRSEKERTKRMNATNGEQNQGGASLPKSGKAGTVHANERTNAEKMIDQYYEVDPTTQAEELIRLIINTIAIDPVSVEIDREANGFTGMTFVVRAKPTDVAHIKGDGAHNLQGIQALVKEIGKKHGRNFRVTFGPDKPGERQFLPKAEMLEDWRKEEFRSLMEHILSTAYTEFNIVLSDAGNKTLMEVVTSSNEKEDSVSWLGNRLKPLVKAIGYKFNRKVELTVIRDQMLFEQTSPLAVA
jgi:predicted RNA-binding protein YlqC (UPF0109 family)